MRKILTAAVAALTLGGAVAATAPAQARPYGYSRYYHRHNDNDAGVAIAAGVVGLALGAALASNSGRSYYDRGYYGRGYYGRGYYGGDYYGRGYYGQPYYGGGYYSRPYYGSGYGYSGRPYGYYDGGYRVCTSKRWVYDPYLGRDVKVRSRYAC